MRELLLGEMIKRRREELGLSREEVAEGVCDPSTLYRVEGGKQGLSYSRARALFQRLNMPDDRYYALLDEHELALANVRREILSCSSRFDRAGPDNKRQAWELAMEQVRRLEELIEQDDTINRQFILSHKATLGTADGPYSFEERLSILLEALRLTVPKFDLDKFGKLRYSIDETTLINQIAGIYSDAGEHSKALALYGRLFDYVHDNSNRLSNFSVHFTLVAHDYARELGMCQYYHRAIEVAEEGRRASINYGHYQFLPGFLGILGEAYYLVGEAEKSKKVCVQAHYLYEILEDERALRIIDPDIKARFGVEFI